MGARFRLLTLTRPHKLGQHNMHTPIDRYCIVFIGVVFYVSAFPESVYPGLFDLAWYSHMWWHIMVATSFVRMYYLWTDLRDYRANNGCPTHV
jgi:hypothetical protein